jgi:hypothetical protein
MTQPEPTPRPDRTFVVDTFAEVVTDFGVDRPAIFSPPPPPESVTETCDTSQVFDSSIIYPDDDTNRELRRGA